MCMQLIQPYVQNSRMTIFPRRSRRVTGRSVLTHSSPLGNSGAFTRPAYDCISSSDLYDCEVAVAGGGLDDDLVAGALAEEGLTHRGSLGETATAGVGLEVVNDDIFFLLALVVANDDVGAERDVGVV